MPAALYKLCRTESRKNPHPVVTTRKAVVISSDQVSARFLCATCEDRFSRNGERYVLSQCARRGDVFKLRKHLESAQPVETQEQFRVYAASSVPEIRIEQFLYFASSVFWRAAARIWRTGDQNVHIDLGAKYAEAFRKYLLGEAPFPASARLFMHVWDDSEIRFMTVFPCSERREGVWRHKFAIPGILFILFVGKEAPTLMSYGALNGSESPLIWLRSWETDGLFRSSRALMAEAPVKSPDLF